MTINPEGFGQGGPVADWHEQDIVTPVEPIEPPKTEKEGKD